MGNKAVKNSSVKKISLRKLCNELSISTATAKNWIKLGKIKSETVSGEIVFNKSDIKKLKIEIQNGENNLLKSRRNKKFITGNKLYNSYITKKSPNIKTVRELVDYISDNKIELKDTLISQLITDCAYKLIKNSGKNLKNYEFLLDDISQLNEILPLISSFNYEYIKDEDTLGFLYSSIKNMSERKSKGAYYTPINIVKKLCSALKIEVNKTVYDPCCGTGNFILQLPDNIDFKNIYANDIDTLSVKIARINFALKYGITDEKFLNTHITNNDFLNYEDNKKYDYIIGNPPWGAEFNDKEKNILREKFECANSSNMESFDLVTEKSLTLLNNNGILSFVLPEAFLNVRTHNSIRKIISQKCSIKYLEYLGNPFDNVMCPSIIVQILYNNKPFNTKGMIVKKDGKEFIIKQKRTVETKYFNFYLDDEKYNRLQKIENISNKVVLKNKSKFALGIVTGANKKYITDNRTDKAEPILKGSDIEKYNYSISSYITFTPEQFQQVAPVEIYRAKEKLLYKFISSELVFAYDNKQTLSLNSCNILIPEIEGLDIKYILAILNSSVAQFYFKNRFNSVKVLRSHIETIPIPFVDKKVQNGIIKRVDKILNKENIENNSREIDEIISGLYGFESIW